MLCVKGLLIARWQGASADRGGKNFKPCRRSRIRVWSDLVKATGSASCPPGLDGKLMTTSPAPELAERKTMAFVSEDIISDFVAGSLTQSSCGW